MHGTCHARVVRVCCRCAAAFLCADTFPRLVALYDAQMNRIGDLPDAPVMPATSNAPPVAPSDEQGLGNLRHEIENGWGCGAATAIVVDDDDVEKGSQPFYGVATGAAEKGCSAPTASAFMAASQSHMMSSLPFFFQNSGCQQSCFGTCFALQHPTFQHPTFQHPTFQVLGAKHVSNPE